MIINEGITAGDKVYVGGLFGKEYNDINNKTGTIKKIIAASTINQLIYIADVEINGNKLPVNFHYLYKIDHEGDLEENTMEFNSDCIEELFKRHRIIRYKLGIAETGETQCIGLTREEKVILLTLTGLN